MTTGMYAYQAGMGPLGTIILGLVAAAFVLVNGQIVFSFVRTPVIRVAIALMFAVPAAFAGYHAIYGLSGITMTSDLWRQVFAVIGSIAIGVTAWTRLAVSPLSVSGGSGRPALS